MAVLGMMNGELFARRYGKEAEGVDTAHLVSRNEYERFECTQQRDVP